MFAEWSVMPMNWCINAYVMHKGGFSHLLCGSRVCVHTYLTTQHVRVCVYPSVGRSLAYMWRGRTLLQR